MQKGKIITEKELQDIGFEVLSEQTDREVWGMGKDVKIYRQLKTFIILGICHNGEWVDSFPPITAE